MKVHNRARLTFRGGVHPPQKKDLTSECAIEPGPVVKEVAVMLSQHIGAPCRAVVRKGNLAQAGEKVGDSDAFVSAPVHCAITGKVKEVGLRGV